MKKIQERIEKLQKFGEKIKKRKSEMVDILVKGSWVPRKIAEEEVRLTIEYLLGIEKESVLTENKKTTTYTVGAMLPFDFPTMMFAKVAGGAYLAGKNVYVRFSSLNEGLSEIIKDILHEAGIKEIEIAGRNKENFLKRIIKDPSIKGLSITGTKKLLDRIIDYANKKGRYFAKIIFWGPSITNAIILGSADPLSSARIVKEGFSTNAGQYCFAIKKNLVNKDIFYDYIIYLSELTKGLKIGPPDDIETDIPPIKNKHTFKTVCEAIKRAKRKGYKILPEETGGKIQKRFIYPTIILTDSPPETEYFGPILYVKKTESDQESIELAKKGKYRLYCLLIGKENSDYKRELERFFGVVDYNKWIRSLNIDKLYRPWGGRCGSTYILIGNGRGKYEVKEGPIIVSQEFAK